MRNILLININGSSYLKESMGKEYNIEIFDNPLDFLKQEQQINYSLVGLGLDSCSNEREFTEERNYVNALHKRFPQTPRVIITRCRFIKEELKRNRLADYLIEPYNIDILMWFIKAIVEELRLKQFADIGRWIDGADNYSIGHSNRVKELCSGIGEELNLNSEEVKRLAIAGLIHDISRIGFREESKRIIEAIGQKERYDEEISKLKLNELIINLEKAIVGQEHYYNLFLMKRREGRKVSDLEEILALSDTYDFLTHSAPSPYLLTHKKAFDELEKSRQFNPQVLNALWIAVGKMRILREEEKFLQMKKELQDKYPEAKFVVLSDGKELDSGNDEMELMMQVYHRFGNIPIYLGQLRGEKKIVRMSSPKKINLLSTHAEGMEG